MNKRMKVYSIILAIVALIGLVTSGMAANDLYGVKAYWKDEPVETNANIDKVDDELDLLADQEPAYLATKKNLAETKKKKKENKKTLDASYAQYAQIQKAYATTKAQHAAVKKQLDAKTATFNQVKVQKVQAKQVYDSVQKLMNGYPHNEAIAIVAASTGQNPQLLEAAYQNGNPVAYATNKATLAAATQVYAAVEEFKKPKSVDEAAAMVSQTAGLPASTIKNAYENLDKVMNGLTIPEASAMVAAQSKGVVTPEQVEKLYTSMDAVIKGVEEETACNMVAQETGKDPKLVYSAYKAYKAIVAGVDTNQAIGIIAEMNNVPTEKALNAYNSIMAMSQKLDANGAAKIVATMNGGDANTYVAMYNAIAALKARGMSDELAIQTIAGSQKVDPTLVKTAYDGMNDIINASGNTQMVAALVSKQSGIPVATLASFYGAIGNMVAAKGNPEAAANLIASAAEGVTAQDVTKLVTTVDSMVAAKGSEDKAVAVAIAATGVSPSLAPTAKNAYETIAGLLACKGNIDAASNIVAKSTGQNPAVVKNLYSTMKGLTSEMSQDQAVASVAQSTGKSPADIQKAYQMGTPEGQVEGNKQLEQVKATYDAAKKLETGVPKEQAIATVAAKTGKDPSIIEKGYQSGTDAAQKVFDQQINDYINGQNQLKSMEKALAATPAQLAAVGKQIGEGEKVLKASNKVIKKDKAKIAEFQKKGDSIKDEIKQVVAIKPDGDLQSIADRLSEDFSYEKSNGEFDVQAGLDAMGLAREYKNERRQVVLDEIEKRTNATIAIFIASFMAILAALLAFRKKYKWAMPCATIASVAAVVASIFVDKAGMVFSTVAGSSMGFWALYAGLILAGVAAAHAVASQVAARAMQQENR